MSEKSPAYLKVAALNGIQRAITIASARNRAPAGKTELSAEFLAIAQGNGKGSEQWPSDLKYWMQRRAVQCLGLMGDSGAQDVVIKALTEILKDTSRDQLWVQLDAVQALDRMPITTTNGKGLSFVIGSYLTRALHDEGTELKASLEDLIRRNILFADTDLLAAQATGKRQGRGGDNLSAGGGGGDMAGPDEGEGKGQSQNRKKEDLPKVEVANFRLNASRRRAKVIAYFVKRAYRKDSPLWKAADAEDTEREFVKTLIATSNLAIKDTDIGITNLDAKEDEDSTPGTEKRPYTLQISEALIAHADVLNDELPDALKLKKQGEKVITKKEATGEAKPADATSVPGN